MTYHDNLTPSELVMLHAVACGMDRVAIAKRWGISPHTASWHLKNMRIKIGATTLAHAVAIGFSRGYITDKIPNRAGIL